MKLSRNQIIIIGGVVLVVLFFVLVFLGVIPGLKPSGSSLLNFGPPGGSEEAKLSFWGTAEADELSSIRKAMEKYSQTGAVQVEYRGFDNADTYEKSLLNAFATGQGPDIFMFHSNWLPKHYDKASPAPEPLNLSYVQQMFPDVVRKDFVSANGKVYALPLYIDTLAFIYNKDIFNAKSIALAPKTWEDFQVLIPQLRELNILNQIDKSAAAIGGSGKSINSASDMLSLLMIQMGSIMNNDQGVVDLGEKGLEAFNFYIQFANPSSNYYTWNDNIGDSIEVFSGGDVAAIFDYQASIPLIKARNPYLNLGVSAMPQFNTEQPINFSNYWGLAVSQQSADKNGSWSFIAGITADPEISDVYIQTGGKPPALRSLIDKYKNDANLGVFARQALTARSWIMPDSKNVKQIFSDMIEYVLSGRLSSDRAIDEAENKIKSL